MIPQGDPSSSSGRGFVKLSTLADGIRQVNQAFIEKPELDGNYPAMVVQYLISALLIALGHNAADFGFYAHPDEVGYTGWLAMGDEVLFFAPTKAVVLKRSEPGADSGELSPVGVLP